MIKSWQSWVMAAVVALLMTGGASAQESAAGTYRIKGTKGDIVLTLRQEAEGSVAGSLKGGELALILNGKQAEDNGLVGKATRESGEFAFYFAVEKRGAGVILVLVEANAEGEPDYATAKTIAFPAADNTDSGTGHDASAQPETPHKDQQPESASKATFAGIFKGDGLTLEIRAQGNDYAGDLILDGEKMPFTGGSVNGVLHGGFEAEGERFDFRAEWQGATLLLTSGEVSYKLKRQGGNNPLSKPNTSKNPLSKPKAQSSPPAKTPSAASQTPGKTASKPTAKPTSKPAVQPASPASAAKSQPVSPPSGGPGTGGPGTGAAWQTFKHPVGLSLSYPPRWKAQDAGGSLMLVPPDVKQIGGGPSELFLVLADNAGPIRSGGDPQFEQYMEQQAAQYLPGFQRVGATQAIKAGNEPGILMTWEGSAQGVPARAQIYATVLKQFGVALLTISAKEQVKASRDNEVRQIFTSLATGAGEKDAQVVGKWFLYSYKGSGSYGRETKSYITLLRDGTALWGQQSESAFSSQDGSFASQGNSGDRGTWSAGKGQLIVAWGDGTTGSWQYRVGGSAAGNRRLFLTQKGKTDEWMEVQ